MTPFIVGFILGAALVTSAFTLFLTRRPRRRREPIEWTPEFHQPSSPPVTTRILVNKREINLP